MDYAQELTIALAAARTAGQMALAYEGRFPHVELKNGLKDSPVSDADHALDAYLHQTLTQAFPQDAWLSEELADDGSRLTKPRCWVVDPIDGTVGFLRWLDLGMPSQPERQNERQFSISIALVEQGVPVVGVVYAPLRDQLMYGVRGQGVFLNGQLVQRSIIPQPLAEAVYLSSQSEMRDGLLSFLTNKTRVQSYTSVAYKLALTALKDHTITASVKPKNAWDLAAGHLLCEEAGLVVTDLAGNPLRYDQEAVVYPGFIAAPTGLYEDLKALLPNLPTGSYR